MPPALSLRDVTFAYPAATRHRRGEASSSAGRDDVLLHADLDVPQGEITVVLGPNGSGKTTMLRLAAGLIPPQHGTVALGDGTSARAASRQGRIGYIPQHLGLVRSASALDNALLGGLHRFGRAAAFLGITTREARDAGLAALDAVGLLEKSEIPVRRLSGGEKQRVAIARTLVQGARIIVADELIASLDVVQAHAVMELQRTLRDRGTTLLMSLHHIDVALSNADNVVFLNHGKLSALRKPEGMSAEEARCALTA